MQVMLWKMQPNRVCRASSRISGRLCTARVLQNDERWMLMSRDVRMCDLLNNYVIKINNNITAE
jgi:hypothetical protein